MLKNLSFLLLFVYVSISCNSTNRKLKSLTPADLSYGWVEQIVDTTMRNNDIPSLSLGIVKAGKLVYAKGFGTLSRDSKAKVTENTLYQIGSDTKKMTGIIAQQLVADGLLQLDTPIAHYLSNQLPDTTLTKLGAINMRQLLTHQAGIPYRTLSNPRKDGEAMLKAYTEQDLLHDVNALQLVTTPGSTFGYSNFGYAIAGYLCEQVSGQSYDALIQKYITQPYKMQHSSLNLNEAQRQQLATPYRKDNRQLPTSPWNTGKLAPAGGLFSNVTDLSKLMILQIEAYRKFQQNVNFKSALILTFDTEQPGGHYGFGLGKSVDEQGARYGHGGDLDGYASGYLFSPEKNVGFILLTSSGGQWIGNLENKIRLRLFQE